MHHCRVCEEYLSSSSEKQNKLCVNCQHRYDMFEAYDIDMAFCSECIYASDGVWGGRVYCHRRSPSGLSVPVKDGKWPLVERGDWCGDGKRRK